LRLVFWPVRYQESYAKLPMKMIKKLSDLRRYAADGAASEGFA